MAMTASIGGEQIVKDFKPDNINYALAVRLTGKFKTAFPDGPPKAGQGRERRGQRASPRRRN